MTIQQIPWRISRPNKNQHSGRTCQLKLTGRAPTSNSGLSNNGLSNGWLSNRGLSNRRLNNRGMW